MNHCVFHYGLGLIKKFLITGMQDSQKSVRCTKHRLPYWPNAVKANKRHLKTQTTEGKRHTLGNS